MRNIQRILVLVDDDLKRKITESARLDRRSVSAFMAKLAEDELLKRKTYFRASEAEKPIEGINRNRKNKSEYYYNSELDKWLTENDYTNACNLAYDDGYNLIETPDETDVGDYKKRTGKDIPLSEFVIDMHGLNEEDYQTYYGDGKDDRNENS